MKFLAFLLAIPSPATGEITPLAISPGDDYWFVAGPSLPPQFIAEAEGFISAVAGSCLLGCFFGKDDT